MRRNPPANRTRSRFLAGLPAVVRFDGRVHDARAYDLSRGGVSLRGRDMPWPQSDEIEVTIRSNAGDLRLSTVARVAHVRHDEESAEIHVGVEFRSLDGDKLRALDDLISRVVEGMAPAPLQNLPPGASSEQVRKTLEAVPLPHRIMMARRALPREREILRQDPSPAVLDGLARNPNLSVTEAKLLLRMAQLKPATIEHMAGDPRWKQNEEVKMLLVTHSSAPLQIAENLMKQLGRESQRKLLQMPGLHDALKGKLRALL